MIKRIFLLLTLVFLVVACGGPQTATDEPQPSASSTSETAKPTDKPKLIEPTSTSTQAPIEPAEWVFRENWWMEPQVMAQSPGTFPDPDGNPIQLSLLLDYEAYTKVGLTVMNFYLSDQATIQDLHDRGILVVAADSMMLTYKPAFWTWSEFEGPPELLDAAMRDPFGNVYSDDAGLEDIFGWDASFVMYSMLHPLWQEHMLEKMKAYVDAGADGYLFDELVSGSAGEPDFNPYTMELFAAYLVETYSEKELQALGAPWGIEDFSNFDYAALVRDYLPTDMTLLTRDDWVFNWEVTGEIPLRRQFQRFLYVENQKAALRLIEETRAYAFETRGIYLPVSTNADPLVPPAYFLMDKVDFFTSEIPYSDYDYFPGARTIAPLKLADYFDIPLSFLSQLTARPQLAAWGRSKTVNLYRTMIADAVASGGAFSVEIHNQDINQDMDALGPYYHFSLDYPFLFEGLEPIRGNIGVLQLWESMMYNLYDHPALLGLFDLLADSGYQSGAIFGGGEDFLQWGDEPEFSAPEYPLNLRDLVQYKVIMIPEMYQLTEGHAEILMQYMQDGGTLVIFSTQDNTWDIDANHPLIGQFLAARGRGPTEIGEGKLIHIDGVWGRDFIENPDPGMRTQLVELLEAEGLQPEIKIADTRYLASTAYSGVDKMVVHFVNYDHEEGVDVTTPTSPVEVKITLPSGLQLDNPTLYLFTPGEMPRELEGVFSGNTLQLTLPEVYIWSVLLIGDEGLLGGEVAALPTFTPTPTPTPTMHPDTYDNGQIIYDDGLAQGWGPGAWGAEVNFDSTTVVYEGTHAVEAYAQQYDGFGFFAGSALDLSPYEWLVFHINIGETVDAKFTVDFWYQDDPIKILPGVKISPFVVGGQLEPGAWHQVAVPLSALNPEGGLIDQVNFNFRGMNDATFYLDEIRFVAKGLPPTPAPTPTPVPTLSTEQFDEGYVIYSDDFASGWDLGWWDSEVQVASTAVVYEGTQAIEVAAQQYGGMALIADPPPDLIPYTWLVFYINIEETTDPTFVLNMHYKDAPVSIETLYVSDYVEGSRFEAGRWHQVVVPLSDLNPEGTIIDQVNFTYDGSGTATFYIDEIRFVSTVP